MDAVVSAYFIEQCVDVTTANGKTAYTKMVEKLCKEFNWLPALEQYMVKKKLGRPRDLQVRIRTVAFAEAVSVLRYRLHFLQISLVGARMLAYVPLQKAD